MEVLRSAGFADGYRGMTLPRLTEGAGFRLGATEESGTQLPWNPNGTRCGSVIRATAGAEMSSASRMFSSLESSVGVVDDRQNPAVVLGGAVGLRDEHGLGAAPAEAVLVGFARAGHDVDLDRGAVQVGRVRLHLGGVAVAVRLQAEQWVVARELLRTVVDSRLRDACVPPGRSPSGRGWAVESVNGPSRSSTIMLS